MVFPLKPPFSYGFPMVFPLKPPFSYGFPMVFPLKPPFLVCLPGRVTWPTLGHPPGALALRDRGRAIGGLRSNFGLYRRWLEHQEMVV